MSAAYTSARVPEINARYQEHIRGDVAKRMPIAVAMFVVVMFIAAIIERTLYPERIMLQAICIASMILTCAGGLLGVRAYPRLSAHIALTTILLLAFSLAMYFAWIGNSAEMCLIALLSYLTGLVILFPWGATFQTAASVGIAATFVLAQSAGAASVNMPFAYSVFSLGTHALLTIIGAWLLDRYRRRAFRRTALAAHHAELAAQANQAKTNFLATVSHELRTPLNIIFGYTDLLIENALERPSERTDALHRIREQSGHLLDMIQALLDINRLEAGSVAITKSRLAVGDVMARLEKAIPASWCKEGVSLLWRTDDAESLIDSDADKLEIVLRNLIHNALKYTERGEVQVLAAASAARREVEFTVDDTGQGIPNDDLERIFEMFRQSEAAPPREGGVGLGLFLAKQLTTALGGTIRAESELNSGSRFTVTLPLAVPEAGEDPWNGHGERQLDRQDTCVEYEEAPPKLERMRA